MTAYRMMEETADVEIMCDYKVHTFPATVDVHLVLVRPCILLVDLIAREWSKIIRAVPLTISW